MLPMVKNPSTGYIQNCNNTPFITTDTSSDPKLEDFSKSFGIEKINVIKQPYKVFKVPFSKEI